MRLPEGVSSQYGIFTTNKEFADKIIDQYVNVIKRVKSANESFAITQNGKKFKWIKPFDNARGNKCSVGIIDLATCSFDFIREWIPAICIFADKEDYIFKDSEYGMDLKPYDLHALNDMLQKIESLLGNVKSLGFYDMEYGWQDIIGIDARYNEISFDSYC